jgi:SAM-dependent methyltransferase
MMTINTVLQHSSEVLQAIESLRSLGLFSHRDRVKSWDTWKMINIINQADRSSSILDIGCEGSPVLPLLRRLGFRNLYGCDLVLNKRYRCLMKLVYTFYKKNYKPVLEMYRSKNFNISVQDLERTGFQREKFDYITSLSVIEHGINIQNYFKEMNRIVKNGGVLLTSTDYWPDKIINPINSKHNYKNLPDIIFSREEIEKDVIKIAEQNGFVLTELINFACKDKVVHWNITNLDYTFIFFALKKNTNVRS